MGSGIRCFVRRVYWPSLDLIKLRISLQLLQLVDIGYWLKWIVECTPAQKIYAVYRGGLGSIPDHMWDLCLTKWHCDWWYSCIF